MADATMDVKTQAPDDAARRARPDAGEPSSTPSWTMSFERLSGLLQN
jgi:hypothetical protein